MENTFFVVLPSNVSDYSDNKPNKFRSHLAKPIQFQGGNWVCGLYSIQYPQSWAATIGTDEKQWIEINYNKEKPFRTGIPKTTQLTPKGLSFFLKLALSKDNIKKSRKRREVTTDTDDLIITSEIIHKKSPSKKRFKRQTTASRSELKWIETFFEQYPQNYWDAIRDLESDLESHKVIVEAKTKEHQSETDNEKKEELKGELDHLTSLSESKKRDVFLLREEANKRDDQGDLQLAKDFLESHPDDYHEQIITMSINLITRYLELEKKIKESKEGDENSQIRSTQEIQRFRNSIKRMRKNLEALESAVIEKDLNTTREEFHQQNSKTHREYVQQFFVEHPTDYWNVLGKNLNDLKELHGQIRQKRDAHMQEQDEEKKNKLSGDIEQLNKLATYRKNRFRAIQQEAMKRAVNYEIPIIPTNDEIKEMQKIEERTHPEYLKHARRIDDQGRPIPIPPPVITEEMIDVVKERHNYEQEKEKKKSEIDKKKEQERQDILDLDSLQSEIITPEIFEEQQLEETPEEKNQTLNLNIWRASIVSERSLMIQK
ncbi:unnamed protein product [Meloidogyne enterolobii]|uniref:Uncharacterized protein n=1 Tax=Meloidogyne enterolobii TaxID=390850 RepID=A0ACB0ZIS8_MELEN